MAGPSEAEQLLLEYLNETRADPPGSATRYISSYAPLRAPDAHINQALTYFGVNGTALREAFAALSPVQPLAWSETLAGAARTHSQAMIDAQAQSHQLPGEAGLGVRATAAGYAGWRSLSENVYAYAEDMLYAHAGFMVDWGSGPNGMQDPAGHRVTIMDGRLNEVGIGVLPEADPRTPLGPHVVTQDFGVRGGAGSWLLGVAYTDRDGNGMYSVGEGRGDLVVSAGGRSAAAWTTGGFQLGGFTGASTVTLTGGGLAAPVSLGVSGTENLKADVVNGTTLKLWNAGAASLSGGAVAVVLAGAEGQKLVLADAVSRTLTGGEGADTLAGGAGHDNIFGGAGADSLSGGDGNDHLYGRAANGGVDGPDTLDGGAGADYLQGNAGADRLFGGDGSDRIQGGGDDDAIWGGSGDDTANGNLGNDQIRGEAGNDRLRGGQGADILWGGDGDDVLAGDLGDDRLDGGGGLDVLTGGPGADIFVFAGGDARIGTGAFAGWTDTITDFDGGDRVDLDFAVAAVLNGGVQADLTAAMARAQALMDARAGDGEVVAVGVGTTSWLMFGAGGGAVVDSAIRLDNVLPALFDQGGLVI